MRQKHFSDHCIEDKLLFNLPATLNLRGFSHTFISNAYTCAIHYLTTICPSPYSMQVWYGILWVYPYIVKFGQRVLYEVRVRDLIKIKGPNSRSMFLWKLILPMKIGNFLTITNENPLKQTSLPGKICNFQVITTDCSLEKLKLSQ